MLADAVRLAAEEVALGDADRLADGVKLADAVRLAAEYVALGDADRLADGVTLEDAVRLAAEEVALGDAERLADGGGRLAKGFKLADAEKLPEEVSLSVAPAKRRVPINASNANIETSII